MLVSPKATLPSVRWRAQSSSGAGHPALAGLLGVARLARDLFALGIIAADQVAGLGEVVLVDCKHLQRDEERESKNQSYAMQQLAIASSQRRRGVSLF